MSTFDVDFFVIGGGSGGVRAARIAAGHGARVALAEHDRMGGTCVIRGCVPKKMFVFGSEVKQQVALGQKLGWTIAAPSFDWPTLRDAVAGEVTRLSGIYDGLLGKAGVTVHRGAARVVDAHTVDIAGQRITARTILVASGGRPRALDVPGADWPGAVVVSDDLFGLAALPRRIVIVGAGFIGVEFAHILAGFGVEVTLAYRHPQVLPGFDDDLRAAVDDGLRLAGVTLRPGTTATHIAPDGDGFVVTLTDGTTVATDLVLAAIGRDPATAGLGLAEVGVDLDKRGGIRVDATGQSSVPSIYAAGDVTSGIALTPIAIRAGHGIADRLFAPGQPTTRTELGDVIPAAVFCQPPAASVGLTETQARARGDVDVFKTSFRPMKHTLTGDPGKALMKLIVDHDSQRVLGVHIVCDGAPEIIQTAAIALTMGATKADFDRTVAVHPTLAEELVLLR